MKRITLLMLLILGYAWQGKAQIPVYGIHNGNGELVSFDSEIPTSLTTIGPTSVTDPNDFENAGSVDPNNPGTAYVLSSLGDLFSVDLTTGAYTLLGNIPAPGVETWTGMEFDPTDGTLYAISADGTAQTTSLLSVDITGLSATTIGITGMGLGISLAIDGNGDIYALDLVDDNLYSVDKTTGIATIVGPIGFNANYGQGMCWDPNTNKVYMATINEPGTTFEEELHIVDTATGATTLVGNLGDASQINQLGWISIPDVVYCPNPENLVLTTTSSTGADFSWDEVYSAFNGYEWSVFSAGADPNTATPLDAGTITQGTLTVSISGLVSSTNYDFYIKSDCDIEGFSVLSGPFAFSTSPENDELANAIMLTVDGACTGDIYTNIGATMEASEPIGSCFVEGTIESSVWFSFVAPASGEVNVTTDIAPANITDSQIAVYEAPTDVNDLSTLGPEIGCSDDASQSTYLSTIDVSVTPGETYYVQVDGFAGSNGTFCVQVTDNLGVPGFRRGEFSFSPNPVSDQLSIKAITNVEQVAIYNLLGQKVLDIMPNSPAPVLDLNNFQTGPYLMKVTINGSTQVFRIIKE